MFQIIGLNPSPYLALYGLSDETLAQHGVRRQRVTGFPGAPDRVSLDAELVDGADLAATTALIDRLLAPPEAAELHVHFAKRGCFAARVVRTAAK